MDIFNKKKVATLMAEIARYSASLGSAREDVCRLEAEVAAYKAAEEAAKRDDSIPWVQINSDGFDANKGVKIAMDWNEAFIEYLEDLEIKGPSANAAVQRWLAMVNLHIIDQLEASAIEDDDMGTVQPVVKDF